MNILNLIIDNWYIIVALTAALGALAVAIYKFLKYPTNKQLDTVREWLLYAVTKAEKELGAGTGQIKLHYTYDMFVQRFGYLAKVIPFDMFSLLVDDALKQMRKMLETNTAANKFVASGKKGK